MTADQIHQRLLDALSRGTDLVPFTVSECYELCELVRQLQVLHKNLPLKVLRDASGR